MLDWYVQYISNVLHAAYLKIVLFKKVGYLFKQELLAIEFTYMRVKSNTYVLL